MATEHTQKKSPAGKKRGLGKFIGPGSLTRPDLRTCPRAMAWMRKQIKDGMAEEIDALAGFDAGDRWFRHILTGSFWRLVSDENPYGPGFWPAHVGDRAA